MIDATSTPSKCNLSIWRLFLAYWVARLAIYLYGIKDKDTVLLVTVKPYRSDGFIKADVTLRGSKMAKDRFKFFLQQTPGTEPLPVNKE